MKTDTKDPKWWPIENTSGYIISKNYLKSNLSVYAEGEVVVDDVQRQIIFTPIVGRWTLGVPLNLEDPSVHLQRVRALKIRKNFRNGLVNVAASPT